MAIGISKYFVIQYQLLEYWHGTDTVCIHCLCGSIELLCRDWFLEQ